jgi:hypothetical protein
MTSDTTNGSKTVKITNKEVMLKNKSYFKKSTGDEAGCAPKKGVLTSVNRGKVYFNAWSMDVKIEGENVVRHLDITTHNHASFPGNSPTWPFLDEAAFDGGGPCAGVANEVTNHCLKTEGKKGEETYKFVYAYKTVGGKKVGAVEEPEEVKRKESIEAMCANRDCAKALKCVLSPYKPSNCCPQPQPKPPKATPHHVVPKSQFFEPGRPPVPLKEPKLKNPKAEYNSDAAPCFCAQGRSHSDGRHGEIHSLTNTSTRDAVGVARGKAIPTHLRWTVGEAEKVGAEAVEEVTGCPAACIQHQLRNGHEQMKIREDDKIRPTHAGGEDDD